MISNRKYRFHIVNPCDFTETYTVSSVVSTTPNLKIEIGAHTFVVGNYIVFAGYDLVKRIIAVTATTVTINGKFTANLTTVSRLEAVPVDPLNFYNTKFIWEREQDEIFFRKKLDGKLKFTNHADSHNDYTYFLEKILANPCCRIKFVVEKKCSDLDIANQDDIVLRTEQNWNIEWEGYLTHNMGKWNLSHCDVETEIEADDPYACLLDSKSEEVNVLECSEAKTVSIPVETSLEEYTCCLDFENVNIGLGTGDNYPDYGRGPACGLYYNPTGGPVHTSLLANIGGAIPSTDCDPGPPNGRTAGWRLQRLEVCDYTEEHCIEGATTVCITGTFCFKYVREVIITFDVDGDPVEPDALGGNTWGAVESLTIAGFPATKWARNPSTTWNENNFAFSCVGGCLIFDYSEAFPTPEVTTFETGRSFSDAANCIVTARCPNISGLRSDFFEINPPGDTPGYVAGTNYVTGSVNKLANMMFIQMSDYLDPNADQPAFIGNITFEQLTALWRIAFNAYWFVDDDGYVRVEHISWFRRNVIADTTSITNDNRHRNKSLKIFSFDRESIPTREEFKWQHQNNIDFVGFPIKYNSPCVNPTLIERYDLPIFSTDTTFLTFLTDPEDKDGFALICLDPDNTTQIDQEIGKVSGILRNNAHLSWANLHYNYHRHDRWLLEGEMNNTEESFLTAKRTKRQVPVRFAGNCCINISPLTDLVTSELGNGQIDKMQKSNRDELYTFELLFN